MTENQMMDLMAKHLRYAERMRELGMPHRAINYERRADELIAAVDALEGARS